MTASDLASEILQLISQNGNLQIAFDKDGVLSDIGSVAVIDGPYLDVPLFVIFPPLEPGEPEETSIG